MNKKILVVSLVLLVIAVVLAVNSSHPEAAEKDKVILDLTAGGVLLRDVSGQKWNASAYFEGTIENNQLKLEGKLWVDGKGYPLVLEGEARKVFIGYDSNVTPKRKMYACHLDLGGDKFLLAGEFFEDGHGGLIGMGFIDGKKYHVGLRGKAVGLFEKVEMKNGRNEGSV